MPQKQLALISPLDGFAGLLNDSKEVVTLIAPAAQKGRAVAAGHYVNRFPDTAIEEVRGPDDVLKCLKDHQDNSLALDFTLLLFDRDLSQRTREDIACELDTMLANGTCREYVLDIMLASPLPGEADSKSATEAAKDLSQVRLLVDTVLECQSRIHKARSAWLAMRTDPMVQQVGIQNVIGVLIHFGVFRRLVEEGKTQADVTSLKARIVLIQGLKERCDPRIVVKFIADYSAALPPGVRVVSAALRPTELNAIPDTDEMSVRHDTLTSRRVSADQQRERAESQVEAIANLFANGNDQVADQYLEELVVSQSRNTNDHSHVVKSLCNIATKCTVKGRRDVSLKYLTRALEFTSGIDAILYIQIGNALRDLKEHDRALICYKKAIELDNGDKRDSINLEIIRVSVAKGDYDRALESYLQLPEIHDQPQMLSALGTLYRKMGNLRAARECFWTALDRDSSYHTALAGLAEALKQSGRHYKAIKRYYAILRDFPDLEEGPLKIYSLALSFLFRLTRQPNNSARILTELLSKYPMDCDVHLQLAKLHMLEGRTDLARHHFQNAQGPSLNRLAAQLFQTAIGEPIVESRSPEEQPQGSDVVLPEDRGIVACYQALTALQQGRYDLAKRIMEKPRYVDHLHADFGAVLGYHAKRKLDSTFSYKADQIICRIAKRGYKELRQSVHAIAEGDFGAAQKMERRMCLLIA